MTWINFCRLNQAIEELTPKQSIRIIKQSWDDFSNTETLVSLFAMEYPMNHMAERKALKWVVEALEVFEDELDTYVGVYGDLGEAVYYFDNTGVDSSYTIAQVYALLSLDCNTITGNSFSLFKEALNNMSALEKKWFIRFMVRKPRNGFASQGMGNLVKLLASVYGKKQGEVKRHAMFNSLSNIEACYSMGEEPETELVAGVYVKPMLAKAAERKKWPKPSRRILEYKYDGARYQIHRDNDTVLIFNRKGVIVTERFTDIVETILSWDITNFIIDTEIYPVSSEGEPVAFQTMNVRFHSKDMVAAMRRCPVELAVFDVLMLDGKPFIDSPLEVRMSDLERFPKQAIREKNGKRVKAFYSEAINRGFEGIMVKNLDAVYQSGKRSLDWIKYKPPRIELDVVIIGARIGEGKRANVYGSYDIAVSDGEGHFIKMGSIGTGFSDNDLTQLTQQLRPLIVAHEKDTHLFSPRVVLQVTSDLITMNEKGNYGLRFPRMMRIRTDKPASEIDTIDSVKGMIG
jgi:DNA ligase-1